MYTITPHTTTNRLTCAAAALALYASEHEDFAALLAGAIRNTQEPTLTPPIVSVSRWLMPSDDVMAETRLRWLMHHLIEKPATETSEARALLYEATRHIEHPKALVIGLIGFAIPFIDFGLIKKKKKRYALRIVVTDLVFNEGIASLVTLTNEASAALLAQELRLVFGNALELEAELAEWLFSDRDIRLYRANHQELNTLITTLKAEKLPHYVAERDHTPQAIALSPSINENLPLGEAWVV